MHRFLFVMFLIASAVASTGCGSSSSGTKAEAPTSPPIKQKPPQGKVTME